MGKQTREKRASKRKETINKKQDSDDNSVILWSFDKIDRNGAFAFDVSRKDFDSEDFLMKMLCFSSMKWKDLFPSDVRKSRHHPLSAGSLSKEAQERINFMKLQEETDSIYSLALNGETRLIGVRNGKVFQVIWYDSKHEFAPSTKKNT